MTNKITVGMKERSYPIYLDGSFSRLGKAFELAKISGKVLVVTDDNVEKFYLDSFKDALSAMDFEIYVYTMKHGESSKNSDVVSNIYSFLLENKFDRSGSIVALGGGVIGDTAGFVAATFLRGINFIQIPTTLLSQVDSSVGGKVGINFEGYKNVVGAFYQPKLVYINVSTLKTLPTRELKAGLAEAVKYGIIRNKDLFEYIEYNFEKIMKLDENTLTYIVKECCLIKSNIVEEDEREELNVRVDLNFGHTIGHAIESAAKFDILHGECVSIGMIGAFKLALRMEMIENIILERIENTFKKLGFMQHFTGLRAEDVYEKVGYDKKAKKGKIYFVLPRKIGEVCYLGVENTELIKEVINDLKAE